VTGSPIAEAAVAVREGELIVFPTDTVYGIGARPDDARATSRLFEAKRRPRDLELPVLGATEEVLRGVAVFDRRADRLAAACWPGPLTMILFRMPQSMGWELGGDPGTIGIRVPKHPLALAVLAATGPMAVTSANLSGEPPAGSCDELERAFGDMVSVYLCEDSPLEGPASTVVDLTGDPARLVRLGALGYEDVSRAMPVGESLLDSRPLPGK
jgi:L-threonylcarbamoyladenylate synthase